MSALNLQPLQAPPQKQATDTPRDATNVVGKAGMIAFIAATSILFAAVLAAYIVVRTRVPISMPALPWAFWISTGAVLISSLLLEYSVQSAYLSRGKVAHRALLGATGMNFLFFGVQATGMVMLFQLSLAFRGTSETLFALTVAIIGLHMLHAVGGLVGLSAASIKSEKHHYSPENIGQIRPLSIFCHFLAIMWMVIFCVLIFANL